MHKDLALVPPERIVLFKVNDIANCDVKRTHEPKNNNAD